jgi:hypothetical protein
MLYPLMLRRVISMYVFGFLDGCQLFVSIPGVEYTRYAIGVAAPVDVDVGFGGIVSSWGADISYHICHPPTSACLDMN